jgi:hypothetical protein
MHNMAATKTTILSLDGIYRLVFIIQTDCVFREVVVNSYTHFIFNNLYLCLGEFEVICRK